MFGVPFGVGLLLAALWRMNASLVRAGLVVLVLSGIATEAADYTGDPAKHVLRTEMAAADYPKAQINEHDDAATYGLITAGVLAVLAAGGLWMQRRKPLSRGVVIGFVVAGLFVSTVLARVAWLGGEIRHVEIRSGQVIPAATPTLPPAAPNGPG